MPHKDPYEAFDQQNYGAVVPEKYTDQMVFRSVNGSDEEIMDIINKEDEQFVGKMGNQDPVQLQNILGNHTSLPQMKLGSLQQSIEKQPTAVAHAINSGQRHMVFRNFDLFPLYEQPSKSQGRDDSSTCMQEGLVPKPIDKGFYYKFNCTNEIKLIKCFLEDNGFLPQPYKIKQMSTTFQMTHGGNKEVKKEGDDWLVLWSTKALKI